MRGDVFDGDGLDQLSARAEHRCERRVANQPQEGGENAAVVSEDEARAEDHALEARSFQRLFLLPLRLVVGRELARALGEAQRAHEDESANVRGGRGLDQGPSPLAHDSLVVARLTANDGDQVDDDLRAGAGRTQACRVVNIAASERAAKLLEWAPTRFGAYEAASRAVLGTKGGYEMATDETGGSGYENHWLRMKGVSLSASTSSVESFCRGLPSTNGWQACSKTRKERSKRTTVEILRSRSLAVART